MIEAVIRQLEAELGPASVVTDYDVRRWAAGDLYSMGSLPVAVVRPLSTVALARAVAAATSVGLAVVPRGGGLSYTGGYVTESEQTVLFDLTALSRIVEISETDMFVTAEAGVTWKQLYDALAPRGLRLPFFGTFSGAGATVGGGLSHGALFFGSARYGSAADIALGLELVTADGSVMRTGQWALGANRKPVFRNFGPDLTGLFLHDGGALGIKTRASLRVIRQPAATGYASFAFDNLEAAAEMLSEVARAGLAEEAYVLDPHSVTTATQRARGLGASVSAVRAVARGAGTVPAAARAVVDLVRGGRSVVPTGAYSLHCVVAGSSNAAVAADVRALARIARDICGQPIAPTVPRMARASPFPNLHGVVGADGRRWAALNAKVAHSEGVALIAEHRQLVQRHASALAAAGVTVTYLLSALSNHSFSFETVFHWQDAWLPLHATHAAPDAPRPTESAISCKARVLVDLLRQETVDLFRQVGAASNQIGRTYPYVDVLDDAPAALVRALKRELDPQRLMNPGVLGL